MARRHWLAGRAAVLSALAASASAATPAQAPAWPDTPLARVEALALLQTLNADLLGHDSATLTLERWCGAHGLAAPARVVAERVRGADEPLPEDLRARLGAAAGEPVKYRRVRLACGGHVLSEADNWYLPGRLTAAMNRALDTTDTPFGKVVMPLRFHRQTLSAELLWSPLPEGWERAGALPPGKGRPLAIPAEVIRHRALLATGDGRPFAALVETYTGQVLGFAPPGG
ncbi:hypothetical protein [Fulvimonas soli]|jgi:hypothetical protein|uniref:Chorismate lyase n=1 Tax=Fulvimonas soli TaxID=155197 RepID=A0A316HS08_9GAMM|nr:hypothetical protein [Fulvimonas soli]PWK82725.1 hypothetical protein C7456_11522 [Fulvimonas soli]TNY26110.1 hypothetical protein BV497_10465 [Fulvimonas soli]